MSTLTAIAKRLGVSEATVSNALSGKGRMKPETREMIICEAKKDGYQVNHTIRNIIKRVIIVAEDLSYNTPFALGIYSSAQEDGLIWPVYNLGIFDRDLPRNAGTEQIRPLINALFDQLSFRPSGMIYISQYPRKIPGLFEGLNIPVVAIQLLGSGADVYINYDNQQGAYEAVTHLAQIGRRRIATISGEVDTYSASERMIGYQRALIDASCTYHPKLIWIGDWSINSGYELTKSLMDMPEPPDAIFVQNDGMARGSLKALLEHGLRVPEDVSIIGFDNSPQTAWTTPKLSSIEIPCHEMGIAAYQKMCELLNKRKASDAFLPCKLILRESV